MLPHLLALLVLANPGPPAPRRSGPVPATPRAPATPADASTELTRGQVAFERGEYARAVAVIRPLLYPEIRLPSEGEVVRAHRMLGFAHLFERQPEPAAVEFRKLLQLRPDYRLDPLLDPPQVVEFFNGIVREHDTELAALEAKRRRAEEEERQRLDAARNGPRIIERRFARNSYAVNFVPFGAGQFQNGHHAKGWAFLAAQATLATVSVGALVTNFAVYGVSPKRRCIAAAPGQPDDPRFCSEGQVRGPEEGRAGAITRVQVASGALFFGVAAWGVIDALVFHTPETPLDPAPATPGPASPGAQARSGLRLAPTLLPNGAGGALSFRF